MHFAGKIRSAIMAFLILFSFFLLTGCSTISPVVNINIEYSTYETDSLGSYPKHEAVEGEKFVVLRMEVTNNNSTESFLIHRMDFYLVTPDQRFVATPGADQMPDILHPIDNNSEIMPGGTVKQTTFFEIPKDIENYGFEYDNSSPTEVNVSWEEADLSW